MIENSTHELATRELAHLRTESDYLRIIAEDPDICFSEYDNIDVIFKMVRDGLIEWRPDRNSRHTSMMTALYPRLTDAGRKIKIERRL